MARHCETFDHTADVGLAGWGETLAELFEALAEGLVDVICSRQGCRPMQRRLVRIEAEDVEALAVDFLTKVLVTVQSEYFLVGAVCVLAIDERSVSAALVGEPVDLTKHEFHTEVKAVTYHQLSVARDGDRWVGRVILDL